jgi:hypothetical protein
MPHGNAAETLPDHFADGNGFSGHLDSSDAQTERKLGNGSPVTDPNDKIIFAGDRFGARVVRSADGRSDEDFADLAVEDDDKQKSGDPDRDAHLEYLRGRMGRVKQLMEDLENSRSHDDGSERAKAGWRAAKHVCWAVGLIAIDYFLFAGMAHGFMLFNMMMSSSTATAALAKAAWNPVAAALSCYAVALAGINYFIEREPGKHKLARWATAGIAFVAGYMTVATTGFFDVTSQPQAPSSIDQLFGQTAAPKGTNATDVVKSFGLPPWAITSALFVLTGLGALSPMALVTGSILALSSKFAGKFLYQAWTDFEVVLNGNKKVQMKRLHNEYEDWRKQLNKAKREVAGGGTSKTIGETLTSWIPKIGKSAGLGENGDLPITTTYAGTGTRQTMLDQQPANLKDVPVLKA